MIYGFIITCAIATIIWMINPRSSAHLWAGATFFTAGLGFFGQYLARQFNLYWFNGTLTPQDHSWLYLLADLCVYSSVYLFPLCYLLFALCYSQSFTSRILWYILPCILVPPFFPLVWKKPISSAYIALFAALYLFFASWVLIRSYRIERNPFKKRAQFHTTCFFTIITTLDWILGYAFDAFDHPHIKLFNYWLVVGILLLFIAILFSYGIMGLRIRIEHQSSVAGWEGDHLGLMKYNHMLKNEISKIKLHSLMMNRNAQAMDNTDAIEHCEKIISSTSHLFAWIDRTDMRIQQHTPNAYQDISTLLDEVIDTYQTDSSPIRIERNFPSPILLQCDSLSVKEAVNNLVLNGVEAMEGQSGALEIGYYCIARHLVLYVRDQGKGIPKKLVPQIIQPFFTTKTSASRNFGLGLTQCNQMIQSHGGKMRINSKEGEGTVIALYFPSKLLARQTKGSM